jgi:sporulation protein YlmC with PRC-barrel domain
MDEFTDTQDNPNEWTTGNGEATTFRGHEVLDDTGAKVGKVTDVLFGEDGQPAWAVVGLGLLGGEHYVPLVETYRADDGAVIIPFKKKMVKAAPKATHEHILSNDLEEELRMYYGLTG